MLPTSSRLLPTRTGCAPLRKYVVPPSPQHHSSNVSQDQQSSVNFTKLPLRPTSSAPDLSRNPNFTLKCGKLGSASISHTSPSSLKTSPNRSIRMALPGTFLPPREQHRLGLDWICSNQNTKFSPPMPKVFPSVSAIYQRKGEKNDSGSKN